MSWINDLLGYREIIKDAVTLASRAKLILGNGLTATDDPTNQATRIDLEPATWEDWAPTFTPVINTSSVNIVEARYRFDGDLTIVEGTLEVFPTAAGLCFFTAPVPEGVLPANNNVLGRGNVRAETTGTFNVLNNDVQTSGILRFGFIAADANEHYCGFRISYKNAA